jgi:hypothetical protein
VAIDCPTGIKRLRSASVKHQSCQQADDQPAGSEIISLEYVYHGVNDTQLPPVNQSRISNENPV